MRVRSLFLYFEGRVKQDGKWVLLGNFKKIQEAIEAGATKFRPRFKRVGGK